MSQSVIKVENLGKLYRLGEIGTGTISHDLNRWWARVRGKEDPFAKIGQVNDRATKGSSDYVWALKDVNFEVKQGEVLGIIGRNGAGKSTLLKLLSKVTAPTTGSIKIKGRIASLLEVGTGFHPELTGRENIYLNGAILGMTRSEIRSKFDEIVDFAGVERYIDTPVKRYSSGMYVRLAFAVAAFLESEIFIVDEVLAVGDADFQKKCLGRMKEVSTNAGRTVLFVSHDLNAVAQLCKRLLLFSTGLKDFEGDVETGIRKYLSTYKSSSHFIRKNAPRNKTYIKEVWICDANGDAVTAFFHDQEVHVVFNIEIEQGLLLKPDVFVIVLDARKRRIFACELNALHPQVKLVIMPRQLVRGEYSLITLINIPNKQTVDELVDICQFEIVDNGSQMSKHGGYDYGMVLGKYRWDV
ncbi:lipopolysaccharide transport system ATP-binding protein [Cnuella takakiae]|uniref:Lipopolysaccharide transport system ATP-binding protein n=1 Tax=Cnuella takakiae TaxID=1302690 RepID=A0A1M5DRA2_9BACT|nr:polysaccharide ABC transporter ATP-binding protein [Cnuella takakiae]OLY93896.1 ABC transporter ATP-binding protein [Cnuella takakiae]SHF69503.1 lipopolysaccharide transport system ATP-binding protein [Cnuella takakiae]